MDEGAMQVQVIGGTVAGNILIQCQHTGAQAHEEGLDFLDVVTRPNS
jgi:hypothetical protein